MLESAAVLSDADVIEADEIAVEPTSPRTTTDGPASSPVALRKAAERQRILDALEQANWNKVKAAVILGVPRRTLYPRLNEFGLLGE